MLIVAKNLNQKKFNNFNSCVRYLIWVWDKRQRWSQEMVVEVILFLPIYRENRGQNSILQGILNLLKIEKNKFSKIFEDFFTMT